MSRRLITISGGTGSGKSTLAHLLAERLEAPVISVDDYYRPFSDLSLTDRQAINYDDHAAIDHDLLLNQLRRLLHGEAIEKPIYSFSEFTRLPGSSLVMPAPYVILEGLFAMAWADLVRLATFRVFVETPRPIRFARRLERDVNERGRTMEEVEHRFLTHVEPMHQRYVEPTRLHANVVVSGLASPSPLANTLARLIKHPHPAVLAAVKAPASELAPPISATAS